MLVRCSLALTALLFSLAWAADAPPASGSAPAPAPAVAKAASDSLMINFGETAVTIAAGGRELLSYRFGKVPFKRYIERLATPLGVNILRDAPHDHLHHHALMYAIDVNGINFWEEQTAPGVQRHRQFVAPRLVPGGAVPRAQFAETIDWVNPPAQETLLVENRTIEASQIPGVEATVVTWESRLACPPGKESVTLTGSHYHGLGIRFLISMDKGGEFISAAGNLGEVFRGTERLGKAAWCAYTADADGKRVTVAMFGHPSNPRGPTVWFTMSDPFAYLSATMNLHKEPLELSAKAPIALRYGVAVWDGRVNAATIGKAYEQWIALPGQRPEK